MTLLIETDELAHFAEPDKLVLIDVRSAEHYAIGHLPGARRLDYASIVRKSGPVGGLLPAQAQFNQVLQGLGINHDSQLVVYDGEGGGAASRLIWTLHAFGHTSARLLNGGIIAWLDDGRTLSTEAPQYDTGTITLAATGDAIISADALMQQLQHDPPTLLDARSIEEFTGSSVRATYAGRIPGAIHLEWTDAIDKSNGARLLPDAQLHAMLEARGARADKPVVVYCQTHHRSSLSYTMLLHLGYRQVTALEGAWSNWGNRDDTPKKTG